MGTDQLKGKEDLDRKEQLRQAADQIVALIPQLKRLTFVPTTGGETLQVSTTFEQVYDGQSAYLARGGDRAIRPPAVNTTCVNVQDVRGVPRLSATYTPEHEEAVWREPRPQSPGGFRRHVSPRTLIVRDGQEKPVITSFGAETKSDLSPTDLASVVQFLDKAVTRGELDEHFSEQYVKNQMDATREACRRLI